MKKNEKKHRKMSLENKIFFWRIVMWGFPILATTLAFVSNFKINSLEKLAKKDDSEKASENFKSEIIETIKLNIDDKANKDFPGFGVTVFITVQDLEGFRRKFIFDNGSDLERNRISIYLDIENNLVFRIIDNEKESHVIKVPSNSHLFSIGQSYLILCEYGYSETYSFMRIFLNGNELARNHMDYKLNFPCILNEGEAILGSDIQKGNFGKFIIGFHSTQKGTLSNEKRQAMFNAVNAFLERMGRK